MGKDRRRTGAIPAAISTIHGARAAIASCCSMALALGAACGSAGTGPGDAGQETSDRSVADAGGDDGAPDILVPDIAVPADRPADAAPPDAPPRDTGSPPRNLSWWERQPCLAELLASCPLDGPCYSEGPDAGTRLYTQTACFASGVGATVQQQSCPVVVNLTGRVTKPGGAPCYTLEHMRGQACENGQFTWRDPTGRIVATGSYSSGSGTRRSFECAATGERASCGPADCPESPLPLTILCSGQSSVCRTPP